MFSPGSSKKIENENGVKGKDDAKSHFFIKTPSITICRWESASF
jgi:hypothetical protein